MSDDMKTTRPLFDAAILRQALADSVKKLSPGSQARNPVIFTVYAGAVMTTLWAVQAGLGRGDAPFGFVASVSFWLWATVFFRQLRRGRCRGPGQCPGRGPAGPAPGRDGQEAGLHQPRRRPWWSRSGRQPCAGRRGPASAGIPFPCDGENLEGIASVDESAITGESAPGHHREAGTTADRVRRGFDRLWRHPGWCSRTLAGDPGGRDPGQTFLDRMIPWWRGPAGARPPTRSP
jgi:K+-transporting ATPase ATPase B chain